MLYHRYCVSPPPPPPRPTFLNRCCQMHSISLSSRCASPPSPPTLLQSLVLVPSSLPSPSPIRADLTAACSVVLWVTGNSACCEKLTGGCLDVPLMLLPLLKVRFTTQQRRCGHVPPREQHQIQCRMFASLLSLIQFWHQDDDASIDVAVASLDAALMHTRRISSGGDCRDTRDASATVCAVSWFLLQQQPALFGRAACAYHIMMSLFLQFSQCFFIFDNSISNGNDLHCALQICSPFCSRLVLRLFRPFATLPGEQSLSSKTHDNCWKLMPIPACAT